MNNQYEGYHPTDWDIFISKIGMLVEELGAFRSLEDYFGKVESNHSKNLSSQSKTKTELEKVSNSQNETFGFIKKLTKTEMIDSLKKDENSHGVHVGIGNELLLLMYKVIYESEILIIKNIKKHRFEKVIYDFSHSRIQELEKELLLWQTINLPDDEEHESDELKNDKIDRQEFRFTELPRLRE